MQTSIHVARLDYDKGAEAGAFTDSDEDWCRAVLYTCMQRIKRKATGCRFKEKLQVATLAIEKCAHARTKPVGP
jgi:hypothetical protein